MATAARDLRAAGLAADSDPSRGMKGQMKLADREHARWCIIVGDAEAADGSAVLKDMRTGEETATAVVGEVAGRITRQM